METAQRPFFAGEGWRIGFLSNRPGVYQVYLASQTSAAPEQLTFAPDGVYEVRPRPAHAELLYVTDDAGDEHYRLHLLGLADNTTKLLTPAHGVVHNLGAWSADGRLLSYTANKRHRAYFDLYVLDVEADTEHLVYRHDGMNMPGRFAPDASAVIVIRPNLERAGDNDLYLLAVRPHESPRHLTPHDRRARWLWPRFQSRDVVLAVSDEDREFLGLQRIDLATGERAFLLAPPWDIEAFALSADGSMLAVVVNADGYSRLQVHRLDATARRLDPLATQAPRNGVIAAPEWRPDAKALTYTFESPGQPPTVWSSTPGTPQAGPVLPAADPALGAGLPEPELVRYPSFDGREIPAYFYRPPHAVEPLPCLVLVHGGPESQSRPTLWGRYAAPAFLLARGELTLFVPNVRGSTGYGKAYSHADDRERRMDAVHDLIAAGEWLAARDTIDPRRIGVMGGSYGGFMALAAITEAPDRWAAAVDLFGIANFVTFLEHTGAWRRRQRAAEYGDDPAFLASISPLHKAARIRTPLLVAQGARDVRVPAEESEQIVRAVRERGGVVEYLCFEREGHGIQKLENRLTLARRVVAFLRRHLIAERP
ncbi:MAG: S9 family peptidase [Gammaproteobacteria bacterium]|nr:S9 family peptidase [Gammaproteobacteria bacterium]NIR83733.1 S9 family peptidase [Gammaproteobacteria bacterium]NIR91881.1 S9 family peptidase [Gammaproteobacteria bacterium]NIU04899.1 S9 family peptidase [Gammaproteobacteria bacterium]NIV51881.1 alpha/beta fold hydrolase [Gammaproteobacteria bacterium]